jgi:hypothetical protein
MMREKARDKPVPILSYEAAGNLHAGAQIAGKVDFETGEFVVFQIVVGRPRAFACNPDRLPAAPRAIGGGVAKRPHEIQTHACSETECQQPGGSLAALVNT